MKTKKFLGSAAIILLLSMACALLGACGSAANVPVADISAAVDKATNKADSLVSVDESYIKGYMKMDVSDYEEYIVKINAYGANIDEYGVFKAKDSSQAKEIASAVEAYLQLREDSWMDEYMPEEKPKLTSAQIETDGNYVMYCILSESDMKTAFDAFAGALK